MKNKGISIFTLIFIGILLLGIGVGVGYLIPKNKDCQPVQNNKNEVNTQTKTNTVITNNTTNTNTTYITNNNVINNTNTNIIEGETTLTENTIANSSNPSEVQKVDELFKKFAKAVNAKDWATVESYSSSAVVSDLKKYNVTNMLVGEDTIQKNANKPEGYVGLCSYNIDYNGLTTKDLSMGNMILADKVNGNFVISSFCATGM